MYEWNTHSLQNDRHTDIILLYLFYCYTTEIFFPHEEGKKLFEEGV